MLALFIFAGASGQITSSTADHRDSLAYPVHLGKDPLFVFYQKYQVFWAGNLTASHPVPGNYEFRWEKYNPDTDGFDLPFSTETGVASSTVSDLTDGGYRVTILNGPGPDTTMMAWVLLDDLHAWVNKDDEDKVIPGNYTCEWLVVSGFVESDTLIYYDPDSHLELKQGIKFSFKWTSDNEELKIPNDTSLLHPNITYAPPFEDTWYILTVTDRYGMMEVDSVLYESIQTKAIFTVEYLDKVTGEFDPSLSGSWSKDAGYMDATLSARFLNESKNGAEFYWVFVDTLGGVKEDVTTYSVDDQPEYTFMTADEYYYPSLLSTSEAGCEDSAKLEEAIFVMKAELTIPNVFSPNADGTNDMWVFKHISIKTCKITVVDRTGKVVYKREIDDIYQWEGWDGYIKDSDRRAPEGQYYFVIEALGYDKQEFKDPTIWEDIQLFSNLGNQGNDNGGNQGGQGTEQQPETLFTGWLYLYRH